MATDQCHYDHQFRKYLILGPIFFKERERKSRKFKNYDDSLKILEGLRENYEFSE